MKKSLGLITILTVLLLGSTLIFAQEDQEEEDIPYLSDDDIAAIELVLPEDIPEESESPEEIAAEVEQEERENEMPRLKTSQTIYHLLILDRTYCYRILILPG